MAFNQDCIQQDIVKKICIVKFRYNFQINLIKRYIQLLLIKIN